MSHLLMPGEVAALKGCSKKSVHRACEQGKLNCEYDPVTNTYEIHDDERLAAWLAGNQPSDEESPSN